MRGNRFGEVQWQMGREIREEWNRREDIGKVKGE